MSGKRNSPGWMAQTGVTGSPPQIKQAQASCTKILMGLKIGVLLWGTLNLLRCRTRDHFSFPFSAEEFAGGGHSWSFQRGGRGTKLVQSPSTNLRRRKYSKKMAFRKGQGGIWQTPERLGFAVNRCNCLRGGMPAAPYRDKKAGGKRVLLGDGVVVSKTTAH